MVPLQSATAGLVQLGIAILLSVTILWVVFYLLPSRFALDLGRRLHVVPRPPQPPLTTRPALERIAADLRRIRHDIVTVPPGLPVQRRDGLLEAYDDRLADACAALDLPDTLHDLPLGPDREMERMRVEYLLEQKGLVLRPDAGQ
jgi:hypothetical protein